MKTVPIHELKQHLSALVEEAAGGMRIVITRHNRPIATLAPAPPEGVRTGSRFGRARLRPARVFVTGAGPTIADVLGDDRSQDR